MLLSVIVISVNASANSQPTIPEIKGPENGDVGTSYEYSFCSTDPENDEIIYCIDWGDGSGEVCIGPFQSGLCIIESKTFSSGGTFTIRAKASDGETESDWGELRVTMPRARNLQTNLNTRLLEIFPNILPIMRLIFRIF